MKATAATAPIQREEALRNSLLALLETCPADYCNPGECPWHSLRQMPYGERVQWFNGLSHEDLAYLAAYHDICFELKLAGHLLADNWHPSGSSAAEPSQPKPPAGTRLT